MISVTSLLRIAVIMLFPVIATAHDSVYSHPASQMQQSSPPPPRPIHPVPTNQHQQNNQTQHPGSRPPRPTQSGQHPHRPHNGTRPKHKPKHDDGSKGPGKVSVGQW